MPKYNLITVLLMVLIFIACNSGSKKQNKTTEHVITKVTPSSNREDVVYQSESLTIRKISSNVYEHTSFLISESFGKVPCNGIVVISKEEAIVFDTPANEESSEELIHYLMKQKALKINAVIATHFHADCVAGLNKFHQYRIPSHANSLTIDLAKSGNSPVPQNGFKNVKEFKVGNHKVIAEFVGAGHTKDNIIGYFPHDKIMFGGCLIKETGSEKGNLADASLKDWSSTVMKLKAKYPDVKIVIPGHGKKGGPELLDYTIELFKQ